MLALAAAFVFLLAVLKVSLGSVSLIALGLLLLSLHLVFPIGVGGMGRRR